MKKLLPLLLALALLLSGCGRREDAPPDPVQDPPSGTKEPGEPRPVSPENPLELDILRIEICRDGLGSERLMEAARTLPELLRSTLAENQSIITDTIQVTIGSSPAATVQALNGGAVDIAILPAEGFAGQETEAVLLLASGPGANESPLWTDSGGSFQASICAAPTDYGLNLAVRAGKEGDLPTWEEMNRARWGLLERDSLPGRRAVDLWLAENYEGNTTASLSRVTVYGDFDQLIQAAEAGEIDVFPRDDSDSAARNGDTAEFLNEKVFSLGQTERFYDMVLAVSPEREDLSAPGLNLKDPLMFTLTQLCFYDGTQTNADGTPLFSGEGCDRETRMLCQDVFGPYRYGWAEDKDLDATRRLLTLEGHTAD